MSDVFIAHVEENADIALEIALGLEQAGYSTWTYEIDSIPGSSYLAKTRLEIDKSRAFVIIISPDSLGSSQIESEMVHAFEERKEIIPVLKNVGFAEFKNRRPDFAQIVGARTAISIPSVGVATIIPRIAEGLKAMGISPKAVPSPVRLKMIRDSLNDARKVKTPEITEPPPPPAKTIEAPVAKPRKIEVKKRKFPLWLSIVIPVLVVIAVVLGLVLPGMFQQPPPEQNSEVNSPSATPGSTSLTPTSPVTSTSTLPPTEMTTTPTPMVETKPRYGGILKLAVGSPPNNIGYPPEMSSNLEFIQASPALETLLRRDNKGGYVPWLATDWVFSPDGKSLNLVLRPGVKFHDHTDFNANAVKYNLDLLRASVGNMNFITLVEVNDDYKVTLKLSRYDTALLEGLCDFGMVSPTAISNFGKEWCRANPVGTGPFKFAGYGPGNSIKYVKYDEYWQQDKPYLDGIEFYFPGDDNSAAGALLNGDVQLIRINDMAALKSLNEKGKFDISTVRSNVFGLIGDSVNNDSPLANVRIRKAISMAIEAGFIVNSKGEGLWQFTNQLAAPGSFYYFNSVSGYTYDPQKAKQFLAEAGCPGGFETTVYYSSSDSNSVQVAPLIKDYLASIGIDANLKTQEESVFAQTKADGWHNGLILDSLDVGTWKEPARVFEELRASCPCVAVPSDYTGLLEKLSMETGYDARLEINNKIQSVFTDAYCLINPLFAYGPSTVKYPHVHDAMFGEIWVCQWAPEDAWLSR